MRKTHLLFRSFMLVSILSLMLSFPALQAQGQDENWTPVGTGIDYQEFLVPGPNRVFVARMDRSNPNVTIDTSIGQGKLSGGVETIRSQAARYDEAINYWGEAPSNPYWGRRNKVVVAINGSFQLKTVNIPDRGMVHSGWYAKRFSNNTGSGFVWKLDRTAFIGDCVTHIAKKQLVTFASGSTQQITDINVPRGDDELILYTPQYDQNTLTDDSGVEVLVEMNRPDLIVNVDNASTGTVKEIYENQGSTPLPYDAIVLSASGAAADTLLSNVQVGDMIGISQEIRSLTPDCSTGQPSLDWKNAYASLGGSFYFLRDGVIQPEDDPGASFRQPRTAVAYNDAYVFFIVVDGRDPSFSVGMTTSELAAFTRDTLSARYGIEEDGGGSSTMVVNGAIRNNTFCNNVFCSGKIFLPLVISRSSGEPLPSLENARKDDPNPNLPPGPDPNAPDQIARAVVNGFMMVDVEPMTKSVTLAPGQIVAALGKVNLRLGPGTNYFTLASVDQGSEGVVSDDINGLNGVLAKGSYWWKVQFGALEGWLPEESLSPLSPPRK